MYIYDLKEWPHFSWDEKKIADLLISLRHRQGRLIGGMESIGFQLRQETILTALTQEVVKSSQIEGEILNPSSVRSSVARKLGIECGALGPEDKNIEAIVEMMLDTTQRYHLDLTRERMFGWHAALFPTGYSGISKIQVGAWRKGPVMVVSGPLGKEMIHFEAPPAERVDGEMQILLRWINETPLDDVLKAAIAHLWFVTIHPFDDGNGRIGRALADLLLARSEKSPRRFYSLSAQIQLERKGYYSILEKTQKQGLEGVMGINITSWIEWFLNCLARTIDKALLSLNSIIKKSHFWENLTEFSLNDRQRKVLNLLLDGFKGKLTSSKWAKIAKCSQDSANRDILELLKLGILKKSSEGGRSTHYLLINV